MSTIAISVTDATVHYDRTPALLNASIDIPFGTFSGVIGMNGAGKSTLFKLMMGLVTPETGRVTICGVDPKTAQKRGLVAYVPQSELIDWDFPVSVRDVVMMGRLGKQDVFKTPRHEDRERVEDALAKVSMQEFADRQIGELSGGQKKRVFVARALAQGAEILLLDEPFAGLDAVSERALTQLLVSLKDEGRTIILATHELTSLSDHCDHVALVKRTVLAYGPLEQVFTKELVSETFDGIIHHIQFKN
jgi:ABC-type Mn2+/Zn2+ transport system ATPase subunit